MARKRRITGKIAPIGKTAPAGWMVGAAEKSITGGVRAPADTPGAAPAAAPFSAPSAPASSPWDSLYERRKTDIDQRWNDYSGAGGTYDQSAGLIRSGFGINQQGAVDPTNPFSRAAALKESYQNSQRGDSNSFASRGLRNSGAYQNAINSRTNNFNKNQNTLGLEAAAAWQQLERDKTAAQRQRESDLTQADIDKLSAAQSTPPVDPGPTFASILSPYQKAGYKVDLKENSDARGNFVFMRQPNTKRLFKLYTNGDKVAA